MITPQQANRIDKQKLKTLEKEVVKDTLIRLYEEAGWRVTPYYDQRDGNSYHFEQK